MKPVIGFTQYKNQSQVLVGGDNQTTMYKAKKYHHKAQIKLKEYMNEGFPCPAGYEKFLKNFDT